MCHRMQDFAVFPCLSWRPTPSCDLTSSCRRTHRTLAKSHMNHPQQSVQYQRSAWTRLSWWWSYMRLWRSRKINYIANCKQCVHVFLLFLKVVEDWIECPVHAPCLDSMLLRSFCCTGLQVKGSISCLALLRLFAWKTCPDPRPRKPFVWRGAWVSECCEPFKNYATSAIFVGEAEKVMQEGGSTHSWGRIVKDCWSFLREDLTLQQRIPAAEAEGPSPCLVLRPHSPRQ